MRLAFPDHEHAIKTAACLGCLLLCLLAACSPIPFPFDPTSTVSPASLVPETALPTRTDTPGVLPSATVPPAVPVPATFTIPAATSIPSATALPPNFWQSLPVIPSQVSQRVRQIYLNGLALGNQPHVFSRIGDCNSAAPAFLVGFDGPYNL